MPIRAHCTICSDFFDNERDVAAIHCGHTFHHLCLIQWFDTAPSRTCPQCRIHVGKRHIITKLFFDVALEEQTTLDAESLQIWKRASGPDPRPPHLHVNTDQGDSIPINPALSTQDGARTRLRSPQSRSAVDLFGSTTGLRAIIWIMENELDKVQAQLSMKEKEKRECQSIVNSLRETLDVRNATIESLQKDISQMEMLCSTLKKQMKYLEQQQDDAKSAKEEARRLRNKLKTMERIETLLQGQRPEVEEMIRDMGAGQAAVEQLAVYCISLKKEYESLKESRKSSNDTIERLRREIFATNHKLQKTLLDLEKTTEELKSTQTDLRNADKEIMSLKKKIQVLQDTIKAPSLTTEALSRLVSESPAPVQLLNPKLHRPSHSDEIDLNSTFDVETPKHPPHKAYLAPAKKIKLDKKSAPVTNLSRVLKESIEAASSDLEMLTPQQTEIVGRQQGLEGESAPPNNCSDDTEDELIEDLLPAFIRNSVLSKRPPVTSMPPPQKNTGIVRIGYDGFGGRTKFIQPSTPGEIRPLPVKSKKRNTSKRTVTTAGISQAKLDNFLK